MESKQFKTKGGDCITVTIFNKRITLGSGNFKAIYSCYDICLIPKLHDNILSEDTLNAIDKWINDNCIYLQPEKPEKPKENEQLSLF